MKRRDFLKLIGVTSTAAVASSCIEGYHWVGTKAETLIPYLVPPEDDHIPGEFVTLPSVCTECPVQCGALVKIAVKAPDPAKLVASREAKTKHVFNLTLQKLTQEEKTAFLTSLDQGHLPEMLLSAFSMKKHPLKKARLVVREAGKQWLIHNQDYWKTKYLLLLRGDTIEVHSMSKKEYWNAIQKFWHGDPIKLDGNPLHPLSRGKLCMRGQASLSRLYHPRRLKRPLYRSAKGAVAKEVSWDQALSEVKKALERNKGKKNLWIGPRPTGSLKALQDEFFEKLNLIPFYIEPVSYEELRWAYHKVVGISDIPHYHIEQSDFLLSFGADLVETFVNPVAFGRATGEKKKDKQWKWYHLEAGISLTGLSAHRRITLRPATEHILLAYLLHQWNEQNKGDGRFPTVLSKELLKSIPRPSLAEVAEKTEIPQETIKEIEKKLKMARRPLVIVGGSATAHKAGYTTALLGVLLQYATGGMVGEPPLVDFGRAYGFGRVAGQKDLEKLVNWLEKGEVGVVFFAQTNLLAYLPKEKREVLEKADFCVGLFEVQEDQGLQSLCQLLLPLSLAWESFGDYETVQGVWNLTRPVVPPRFDTLSLGDVLLRLIGAEQNYEEYLQSRWEVLAKKAKVKLDRDFWARQGVLELPRESVSVALREKEVLSTLKEDKHLTYGGVSGMAFLAVPSLRFFDGRSRSLPLLWEVPDPLSSITYGQWISVSPALAKKLKLKDGDLVECTLGSGETLSLPARLQEVLPERVLQVQYPLFEIEEGRQDFTGFAFSAPYGMFRLEEIKEVKPLHQTVALPILSGGKKSEHMDVLPPSYGGKKEHGGENKEKPHKEKKHKEKLLGRGNLMYPKYEYPEYKWTMAIDLDACNGCSACVVACYVENNVPLSGKAEHLKGREMSWIRIEPYVYRDEHGEENLEFVPMVCQQCDNAPCESVCPVYASVHNSEGLNVQVYNRCVGTRYCANNCPYKVRRFNWFDWFGWPEERILPDGMVIYGGLPLGDVVNPDVSVRTRGIMEKCTFCIHRIRAAKEKAKDENRKVRDGEVLPACAEACPTSAITFGSLVDKTSKIAQIVEKEETHRILDHELNTKPSVYYIGKKG